jgi:hypothetical protein
MEPGNEPGGLWAFGLSGMILQMYFHLVPVVGLSHETPVFCRIAYVDETYVAAL